MSIKSEKKTVGVMIQMYCTHHHQSSGSLCEDCTALLEYAEQRLEKCPHGEEKSACQKCPLHCYSPAMRHKITAVMEFAGPRMIFKRPLHTLLHVFRPRF